MSDNNHQDKILKFLTALTTQIQEGTAIVEQIGVQRHIVGLNPIGSNAIAPSHTGKAAITLEITYPAAVEAHNQEVHDALIPGIPVYLQNPIVNG